MTSEKPSVFVTGASAGFGQAIATLFSQHGYPVVLTGRRRERLGEIAATVSSFSPVHCVELDVRDQAAVVSTVGALPLPFATIGILVNNAGLALGLAPSHQCEISDWETMVDTNINGLLYCTRAVLPGMVERNSGHIVNIGSIAGSWPYAGGNVYGATKAFVQQFSRNLHAELVGTRIRVTNIEPGLAETEFSRVRFKGDNARAAKVYEGTEPLTPQDIAETVLWCVERPAHVNINSVEMMPTCQTWAGFSVQRSDS